ncbi:MAG: HAD family acid phosphatase, partial [Candidatus Babeliales bacterium]
ALRNLPDGSDVADPCILSLCKYFNQKNIKIFYVTGRDQNGYQKLTVENLRDQGFPDYENVVCFPEKERERFLQEWGNNGREEHPDEFCKWIAEWKHKESCSLKEAGYWILAMIDDQEDNLCAVNKLLARQGGYLLCLFAPLICACQKPGCNCLREWQDEYLRQEALKKPKKENSDEPSLATRFCGWFSCCMRPATNVRAEGYGSFLTFRKNEQCGLIGADDGSDENLETTH